MNWIKTMGIKQKLFALVMLCIAALAIQSFVSHQTLTKVKISGELYHEISEGKDLLADILPPPAYLIESYLLCHQMANPGYAADLDSLEARSQVLRVEFNDRVEHWEKTIKDPVMLDAFNKLKTPTEEFFRLQSEDLLTAVRNKDFEKARHLVYGKIHEKFTEHRKAVEDLVKINLTHNTDWENEATETVSSANTWMARLIFFLCLLVGFIGYLVVKDITSLFKNVEDRTAELSKTTLEFQKSEMNARALLNAIPDAMWRTDTDGNLLDFAYAGEWRKTDSQLEWHGKSIFEYLPKDLADEIVRLAKQAHETNETQDFEYKSINNHHRKYYQGRIAVCGDAELLTIVRDVTATKQIEIESKIIAEIAAGVQNTSSLKELLIHIHKLLSKVIYAENFFVALFDSSNQMLDMQFFVDKIDKPPTNAKLGKGLTSYVYRKQIPLLINSSEMKMLDEAGEIAVVGTPPAIWLGIPLFTPQKGIIGVLVVQHYEDENAYGLQEFELLKTVGDQIAIAIELKASEKALQESEARFQNAFDYAPIGISLTSPKGDFIQVNKALCKILGYTKEELLQTNVQTLTNPKVLGNSPEIQVELLSGKIETCQIEKCFIHKLGHDVLALVNLSTVRDAKNRPLYIIGQIQDISEQKSLEAQIQRGQKLESIGQLAAGIAHEINTPTQYVGDNTRFLKDSFQDFFKVLEKNQLLLEACRNNSITPEIVAEMEKVIRIADVEYLTEEIPKAIEQTLHGVERISKIVQSMKEFAHPGSENKKLTDLNRAIESTLTVASNEWKYIAEIETNYDEKLPFINCLPGEFNQVVLNLIINASHAIADVVGDGSTGKGKITISTTKMSNKWAEIRIADTGNGIPLEIQSKIFDPFFTTKDVGQGTGQGLAISHTVIVDNHNGRIDFETEAGKGTTFIIQLPLNSDDAPNKAERIQ